MPRATLLYTLGILHHVMGQGIETQPIFLADRVETISSPVKIAKHVLHERPLKNVYLIELRRSSDASKKGPFP